MSRSSVVQFPFVQPKPKTQEREVVDEVLHGDKTYRLLRLNGNFHVEYYKPEKQGYGTKTLKCRHLGDASIKFRDFILDHGGAFTDTDPRKARLAVLLHAYGKSMEGMPSYLQTIGPIKYAIAFFGDITVAEMTVAKQADFIKYLGRPKAEGGRGCKASTISRYFSVIPTALRFAMSNGHLDSLPALSGGRKAITTITRQRFIKPKLRRLTIPEMAKFVAAFGPAHMQRYIRLAIMTLARPQAILDLTHGAIHWPDEYNPHGYIQLLPDWREENKKRRPNVPLPAPLMPLLKRWLEEDGNNMGKRIVNYRGTDIKKANHTAFDTAAILAGLYTEADYEMRPNRKGVPVRRVKRSRAVTPYTIRRSVATILRNKGIIMDDIAGLLGHDVEGREITERYAYLSPEQMDQVLRGLEWLWEEIGSHMQPASDINNPTPFRHYVKDLRVR